MNISNKLFLLYIVEKGELCSVRTDEIISKGIMIPIIGCMFLFLQISQRLGKLPKVVMAELC